MILWCAFALLACRLVLALVLIPPWQHPDEPTHVAYVELQRSRIMLLDGASDPAREAEILQSMVDHDWWIHRAVAFPVPTPMPERFKVFGTISGLRGRVVVDVVDIRNPPLFHVIAGRLVHWLPRGTVVRDMYVLRVLSAFFGLLTLWVAWRAAHEMFGEAGASAVALLLAIHPQFALVATSASPDAAANFFGACAWWAAVAAVSRDRILLPLAAMWTAAVAATLADRVGVPLVAIAFVAALVAVVAHMPRRTRRAAFMLIVAIGVAETLAVAAVALSEVGRNYNIGDILSRGLIPVPGVMTWSSFVDFTWYLVKSWWHVIGWGRYPPPAWWTAVAALISAAGVVGLGRQWLTARALDDRTRMLLALAAVAVAIQLAAVYWTYFRLGIGGQGRYLFPVLVPSLLLLWMGLEAYVPPPRRTHAAAALVLLFGFLDAVAWALVAIPAYYASF